MIEFIEAAAEGGVGGGEFRQYSTQPWPQDARVGASEEPSGAQAEAGQAVAVALGDTFDHSMETQAAEVVSHPALGQVSRELAE